MLIQKCLDGSFVILAGNGFDGADGQAVVPDSAVPGGHIARNMDKPASARSAAGTVDNGNADPEKQNPAPVVHPALFEDRVVTPGSPDFRSWRLVNVFDHTLLADAEGCEDPIQNFLRSRHTHDLPEAVKGLSEVECNKFRGHGV